jgi:phosphoribosyl 1,2-cyclic phosphodiesterase/anti-anti-sigma regulatory factor
VRVKFWGVRGSIPTPLSTDQLNEKLTLALSGAAGVNLSDPAEVQAYLAGLPAHVRSIVGGNTTCVEVDTGAETLIIDGGSGMRALGLSLMAREFGRGQGVAHIFLTHAHWDHLQGYPFFAPAYVPGNRLIFYAVNHNPQTYLEHQQVAPTYFPIPPNAMPADKEFVQLREGETVQIGRTVISNLSLYHPGTAYAYRFDDGESVFVFASDGEYKSLNEVNLRRYIAFFSQADALVFDAQYSLRDVFLSKADWGHSSAIIGVDIAERARARRLITFHHDPTHTDEQIYAIASAAREYAVVNDIYPNTQVIVGTEGLELFLGQAPGLEVIEAREDGLWTLALAGQLNAATVDEAQARLAGMLARQPVVKVILDLTLLASVDALGIKGLLDTARAHAGQRLAVLAPAGHIRRALDQSGASEVVPLVRSRAQALATLAGPAHLRLAPATLGAAYQLDELLFVDELGVVYQGRDAGTRQPLLVRVVAGSGAQALTPPEVQRLRTDLKDWPALQHPNLAACQPAVEVDGWLALACPAPEGVSLREWLSRPRAWADRWQVAGQLCAALAALHAHGLTHSSLLPEAIVVAGARAQVSRAPLFPPAAGRLASAYQAPEQLRGQPATPRSDVYALGVLLYELFLDAHPFAAETDDLRLTLQLYSQPQSPRARWPEIPAALESFLLGLLAPDPAERPADGEAVCLAFSGLVVEAREV